MNELTTGFTGFGILVFCFGLFRLVNGKYDKKVDKTACHEAQKAVRQRIDDLQNHINTRFDDVKDFIKKNGTQAKDT